MEKNFLYFQPQYVNEFKCDGSKCGARCCKGWNVYIDKNTYEQYSQIKPEADAEKILALIKFNSEKNEYVVTMDEHRNCPFLDEDNLCRLQRKYGENFLSAVCSSYPRRTLDFGKFFERALLLTCPVAAEKILFRDEPLQFELITMSEEAHLRNGKVGFNKVYASENFVGNILEAQIAMISILQERTLSIDQRLIVLGFFLDRLDELTAGNSVVTKAELEIFLDSLTKLIAAYESKEFLAKQVPLMLATVHFDAKKFAGIILMLLEKIYTGAPFGIINLVAETLNISPDADGKISGAEVAANYETLADERKKFSARYSTFMENYLVNELFLNCIPWKFPVSVAKNFGLFVAEYKIFELLMFSAVKKNFDGKDDLLKLTDWFSSQADHEGGFEKKFLEFIPDDTLLLMEMLLEQ